MGSGKRMMMMCVYDSFVCLSAFIFSYSHYSLPPSLSFHIGEPFISDAAILNYNKTYLYTHLRLMLLLINSIDIDYYYIRYTKHQRVDPSTILDLNQC